MSQQYKIGSHKTTVSTDNGYTSVVYHSTAVVKFSNDKIILNSGGYQTSTTKTRMNQASSQFDLGFRVFQKDFDWFVKNAEGEVIPFTDNMVLKRDTVIDLTV